MKKTIQVATDRAYDETKTVLPAEMARGVYLHHAPSLRALKLMHLMIGSIPTKVPKVPQKFWHWFDLGSIGTKVHEVPQAYG